MSVITEKRYKNSLTHTPCKDTCEAVQKSQVEDEKIRELGKRLKHAYIESGKKVKETNVSCSEHNKYTFKRDNPSERGLL